MIVRKSAREIELMRMAGKITADALRLAKEIAKEDVTTDYLNTEIERYIVSKGGIPIFKGYRGFPKSICTSINEEVVHGIPGPRIAGGLTQEIRMSLTFAVLLASVTVTVTSPGSTPSSALGLLTIESNIVRHTNTQRARYGLPPLQIDAHLMASARRHAAWMARSRMLQHTSATVAENIAMGQSSSSEAVADWMSSSGHRANILGAGYSRIGAAAYRGRDGQIYWCQQFLW